MKTLPLSEAKAHLSALVDEIDLTQEHLTITRHGKPAAVLISADEWASMEETAFWTSVPDFEESLTRAKEDVAEGRTFTTEQVRAWVKAGMPAEGPVA